MIWASQCNNFSCCCFPPRFLWVWFLYLTYKERFTLPRPLKWWAGQTLSFSAYHDNKCLSAKGKEKKWSNWKIKTYELIYFVSNTSKRRDRCMRTNRVHISYQQETFYSNKGKSLMLDHNQMHITNKTGGHGIAKLNVSLRSI